MDIKSLKDKILQLAIQGKLVPQDENDEPASVLLEKIKAEKEQLIKDKVIKKEKPLPEISEEEKVFDLPKGWEWCRLGNISTIKGGKRIPAGKKLLDEPTEHMYIRVADMKKGTIIEDDIKYISDDIYEKIKNYYIEKDDIYITIAGTIGRVGIIPDKFHMSILTENASKIRVYNVYKDFIFRILDSQYIQTQISNRTKKVGQPKLALNQIASLIIPLPPLEEQKRIVAKVDELFELIDELDNNKQELLDSISNTRNKVLQLAIQGKLVEQCEDDEPASVLLERIKAEKEQLIKDKVIKKEKPLPEISDEEKSFDLPKGWEWCRLGNISQIISKGTTPKGGRSAYKDKGINFLRVENITDDFELNLENIMLIDKDTHENELKRSIAQEGDLLISIAGSLGRVAIVKREHIPCNMNQAISFVRLVNNQVFVEYLKYVIAAPLIKEAMISKNKTTAQPNLTLEIINKVIIPIPPSQEQKRIVAKVDLIMDYLDKLQQEIESQEIILKDILQ